MPVIKSARKKLKQDKKRTLARSKVEASLKDAVKKATVSPTAKSVQAAFSMLDKAAKAHIIHGNKAARFKSRLSKLLSPKKAEPKIEAPAKKASVKKASVKKSSSKKK